MEVHGYGGVILLFISLFYFEPVRSGYLITTPRVYRTGTVQQINVHLYDMALDYTHFVVKAVLKSTHDRREISRVQSKAVRLGYHGEFVTLNIKVPSRVPVRYNQFNNVFLEIVGIGQYGNFPRTIIRFRKSIALTLEKQKTKLFIQTDKPVYKPGQTVHLRVIGINQDLKPLDGKIKKLFISNPGKVRMMQWNNLDLVNGIASVKLPLSKHPVLGKWKIQAQCNGEQVQRIIEVSKYVLPKFEVSIDPPPFVTVDTSVVTATICAKYTYGQLVTGLVNVVFDIWIGQRKARTFTIYRKITGCHTVSLTNSQLGLRSLLRRKEVLKLTIKASMTEEGTGITRSADSTEITIVQSDVRLEIIVPSTHFKPGLPFYGQVRVTSPDGEPLASKRVTITAREGSKAFFRRTLTSSPTGIIDFEIETQSRMTKEFELEVGNHGWIPTTTTTIICLPWYSPTSSFLILKPIQNPLKVGTKSNIGFRYTLKRSREYSRNIYVYNLMCKGAVVLSEAKRIPTRYKRALQKGGTIVFNVTQDMVPACRLLVYYIREDGEVVADSMVLDIQDKLENQVVVRFDDSVRRPGEPVQITMTTTPGSTVALSGVDKSVRLLAQDEQLDENKIINALPSNPGPSSHYGRKKRCYQDIYVDTSKAIYDAGLIFLSDSRVESRPCRPFPTDPPIVRPTYYVIKKRRRPVNIGWARHRYSGSADLSSRRTLHVVREEKVLMYGPAKKRTRKPNKPIKKAKPPKPIVRPKKTNTVRKNFPETWLWTEESISNSTGVKTITAQVPDTITSWYLSAFAMSSTRGMGVANPSTLTVFQPFFVSFTLPYSVIRGEQVSFVTSVFNYMSECATFRVRLTKTDHFHLSSAVDQKLCICGNEVKSVKYVITTKKLGSIPLTVTVETVSPSLCVQSSKEAALGISDAVTRKLLVEPEGVRQEYTYSKLICPKDNGGNFSDNLILSLPKKVVQGSVQATVSATGDLMGPSLSGLEGLLRLPTGCGEQNMVNFAPNIFVMQYLKSSNQLTSDLEDKAIGFLRTGYQRELTYKRKDGSYSAFGDRDSDGSLWLTSFVLRSFSQARPYIFVDDEEIKFATRWIKSKQLDSGCFRKHGRLLNKGLKGGVSTHVTLTAYVVISLLESQVSPQSDVIVKALKCISDQKDHVTDPYSNAIIAYALTLAKHPGRSVFLKRVKSQATVKGDQMFWEVNLKPKSQSQSSWVPPYSRSSSTNIEMTSYALMAMIGDGGDNKAIIDSRPVVRWLSEQRNAQGGFSSTQDTCVALQALSTYARYAFSPGTRLQIDVGQSNGQFNHTFHINDNNKLVLQRLVMPQQSLPLGNVLVDAVGDGCALVQADVVYHVPDVDEEPAFNLSVSVRPHKSKGRTEITEAGEALCQPLEVNVCARWLDQGQSDMAVIEVKLISGFILDEESLERLMNRFDLNLMKFEIEENKVVFYFNEIQVTCFRFTIQQTTVVKKTKPTSATVYEYYDTDKSATTLYKVTEEDCKAKKGNQNAAPN